MVVFLLFIIHLLNATNAFRKKCWKFWPTAKIHTPRVSILNQDTSILHIIISVYHHHQSLDCFNRLFVGWGDISVEESDKLVQDILLSVAFKGPGIVMSVHYLMLSHQILLCRPAPRPPSAVSCIKVLKRVLGPVTWPNHEIFL